MNTNERDRYLDEVAEQLSKINDPEDENIASIIEEYELQMAALQEERDNLTALVEEYRQHLQRMVDDKMGHCLCDAPTGVVCSLHDNIFPGVGQIIRLLARTPERAGARVKALEAAVAVLQQLERTKGPQWGTRERQQIRDALAALEVQGAE